MLLKIPKSGCILVEYNETFQSKLFCNRIIVILSSSLSYYVKIDTTAKIFYLIHCSDYPLASFTALDNGTCVIADQGMDSLMSKLKAFYVPKKAGKTEVHLFLYYKYFIGYYL